MKKFLLVGDNRLSKNWGARAGSIALYQLLEKKFDVLGSVYGGMFGSPQKLKYVNSILPEKVFNHIITYGGSNRLGKIYLAIEQMLGTKKVITADPEKNVDTLLRFRKRYALIDNLIDNFEKADTIVVNGEGDMVFTTPPRLSSLRWLTFIILGKRLGKKVFYVNGIVSDCPFNGRNRNTFNQARECFKQCDGIAVRDLTSLKLLNEDMPELRPHIYPDSLFNWYEHYKDPQNNIPENGNFILPYPEYQENINRLNFLEPYICLGGSASAPMFKEKSIEAYIMLVEGIKKLGINIYLTQTCNGDSFLPKVAAQTGVPYIPVETSVMMAGAILANARVFISGRYHPSIFASLGGTPCVFLDTHSHKMKSLKDVLEYKEQKLYSFPPEKSDITEIVDEVMAYINNNENARAKIRSISKKIADKSKKITDILNN